MLLVRQKPFGTILHYFFRRKVEVMCKVSLVKVSFILSPWIHFFFIIKGWILSTQFLYYSSLPDFLFYNVIIFLSFPSLLDWQAHSFWFILYYMSPIHQEYWISQLVVCTSSERSWRKIRIQDSYEVAETIRKQRAPTSTWRKLEQAPQTLN